MPASWLWHHFGSLTPSRLPLPNQWLKLWLPPDCHCQISDSNFEIFQPNQFATPAARIQAFINGAIGMRLTNQAQWICALSTDKELFLIWQLVNNPLLINNKYLRANNYNFHLTLQRSLIVVENDLLIYREPISHTGSYGRLTIVPKEFYNVLFVAFHTNSAGGHLNSYHTLHHLCLCSYWPRMYSYIKKMCAACPGCALANPTKGKSSKLVYNFPIKTPFWMLQTDAYSAGAHSGFKGSTYYLVGCCGMCSFGILKLVASATASTFASAIMKMQLRFGFCHTVVLDKDSKDWFSSCVVQLCTGLSPKKYFKCRTVQYDTISM